MALQTVSISSTAAVVAASATSTSNSGSTDNDLNGRNSIPFSFLVAFLALFVIFMTLGLCARRIIYHIRLQLGLPVPLPRRRVLEVKRVKPVLWDVYPEGRIEGGKWHDIEVSYLC